MLRLKSLRIDKLRKVQPGTILNFTGDKNLVLGKNGVGKTTLLEVIACAAKLDFSAFADEEIDVTVGLAAAESASLHAVSIESRFRHVKAVKEPSVSDSMRPVVPHNPIATRIDLEAVFDLLTVQIQIANNKVVATKGSTQLLEMDVRDYFASVVDSLDKISDSFIGSSGFSEADRILTLMRPLLSRLASKRLDESLDVVRASMAKKRRLWTSKREFGAMEALEFAEDYLAALILSATSDGEQIFATSEEVKFLREFADLVNADLVKTIFYRGGQREFDGDDVAIFHDQTATIHRSNSVTYFDQFSYGQKRLFGILQHLASNEEIVVADEITNGLHHEWIDFIVKKLEGRQCFLTSQNPVLLDFLTFTSAAETQNRLIRCEHGANGTLIWRNLTEQEANDFYTSYETGMQHVGEIMLKQGLW